MGRYLCGPSVLRDAKGKALGIPKTEFSFVFRPEHEAALIAGGAITRLDDAAVYEQDWIEAGYVEPPVADKGDE